MNLGHLHNGEAMLLSLSEEAEPITADITTCSASADNYSRLDPLSHCW